MGAHPSCTVILAATTLPPPPTPVVQTAGGINGSTLLPGLLDQTRQPLCWPRNTASRDGLETPGRP